MKGENMINKPVFLNNAERSDYNLKFSNLPSDFNGFKIAHISDLHSHPADGIFEIVQDFAPDITVITGDLLHNDNASFNDVTALLKKLTSLSPVYFISGNHDLWHPGINKIFSDFCSIGTTNLDDTGVKIEKNNQEICLFGISDPFSRIPSLISDSVKKSLDKIELISTFNILLFHRANLYPQIKDKRFDLILTGHMHGGQVRLPHIGGIMSPTSSILSEKSLFFPKYNKGVYKENGSTMIVNGGASNTLPIPRFFNPPEVGCITLFAENS